MRLRDRARNAWHVLRGNWEAADDFWYRSAAWSGTTLSGLAITPEGALAHSAVQACVRIISGTVAKVPAAVYERIGAEDRKRVKDHPVHYALNVRPNPWQTSFEFRRMMTAHVALRGNAIAVKRRTGNTLELIPVHPDRVRWEQNDDFSITYRVSRKNGSPAIFAQSEVLHLRDLTLDGVTGLSRIEQAREGVALGLVAEQAGASFFGNDATPAGYIKTDQPVTEPQRKAELKVWNEVHGGRMNRGKTAFLGRGAEYKPIQMTNKDAQYIELRAFQIEDVARLYGLPPHLIGQTEKQTSWGTGVEQMSIGFVAFHMLDWFVVWESAAARDLFEVPQDEYLEHIVDALLRADYKTRMEGHAIAIANGISNPDEARRRENMNARTDGLGGRYLMPSNARYADEAVAGPVTPRAAAHARFARIVEFAGRESYGH